MVSIQVSKGQGLTQALKTYADSQGYDVSGIKKQNWLDTISKLEHIQKSREDNKQDSIYTEIQSSKPYGNMLVHEGNIEFSDAEIQSLFQTMGLETKTSAYENWTVAVAQDAKGEHGNFQIKSDDSHDEASYNKDLAGFADEYIASYDTNKDGKISYDEFAEFEVKQVKDNAPEIDEESLEEAKKTLKTTFSHIDVDKESSKDALDKEEIMNFFFSMDSLNDNTVADGYISKKEYISMNNALADDSKGEDSQGNIIFNFLKRNYEAYFKKLKQD